VRSLKYKNEFSLLDKRTASSKEFNPLNSELNPICHLPALLGVHHILHVSRIRVKLKFALRLEAET
jgi:hypothetical protein